MPRISSSEPPPQPRPAAPVFVPPLSSSASVGSNLSALGGGQTATIILHPFFYLAVANILQSSVILHRAGCFLI